MIYSHHVHRPGILALPCTDPTGILQVQWNFDNRPLTPPEEGHPKGSTTTWFNIVVKRPRNPTGHGTSVKSPQMGSKVSCGKTRFPKEIPKIPKALLWLMISYKLHPSYDLMGIVDENLHIFYFKICIGINNTGFSPQIECFPLQTKYSPFQI